MGGEDIMSFFIYVSIKYFMILNIISWDPSVLSMYLLSNSKVIPKQSLKKI